MADPVMSSSPGGEQAHEREPYGKDAVLSEDEIQQARELVAGATPGPWFHNVNDLIGGWLVGNRDKPSSEYDNRRESGSGDREVADFITEADAKFIAAARVLLPKALDALEASQAQLQSVRANLELAISGPPAQMSYAGRLLPINSTGMREVVDEATRFQAERDQAMADNQSATVGTGLCA